MALTQCKAQTTSCSFRCARAEKSTL